MQYCLTYRTTHNMLAMQNQPHHPIRYMQTHALLTSRYGTANLPYLSTSNCLLGLPLTVVCCTKGISRATSFSLTTCTHIVTVPANLKCIYGLQNEKLCCKSTQTRLSWELQSPHSTAVVTVTRPMFGVNAKCSPHRAAWHAWLSLYVTFASQCMLHR